MESEKKEETKEEHDEVEEEKGIILDRETIVPDYHKR